MSPETSTTFLVSTSDALGAHAVARPSAAESPVWIKTTQLEAAEIVDVLAIASTSQVVATIHKPTRGFGIAIRLVGWPEGVYTSLRPTRRGSSRHFSFAVEDEPTPAPDQDDGSRLAAPGPLPPKRRRMFTIRPTERPTGSTFSLANLRNLFSSSDSGFSIHDADDVRLLSYVDKSSLMSTDTHGAIEINDGALRQSGFDVPLELLVAVTLAVVDVTIDAEAYEAAQADLRE